MGQAAPAYASTPRLVAGQRAAPRARLDLPGRLVTFNGTSACTLIDMSRSGAKIGASETPRVGSMVVIEGLPLELFGNVRWAGNGLFGVEFDKAFPLAQVVAMRRYADDEPARQRTALTDYARTWVQGAA